MLTAMTASPRGLGLVVAAAVAVLAAVALVSAQGPGPSPGVLQQTVAVRVVAESDRVFSQGLLWTAPCSSLLRCAETCLSDRLCVCFTVTCKNTTGRGRMAVIIYIYICMSDAEWSRPLKNTTGRGRMAAIIYIYILCMSDAEWSRLLKNTTGRR